MAIQAILGQVILVISILTQLKQLYQMYPNTEVLNTEVLCSVNVLLENI